MPFRRRARSASRCFPLVLVALVSATGAQPQDRTGGLELRVGETLALPLPPRQEQAVRIFADPSLYNEVRISLPGGGVNGSYVKVLPPRVNGAEGDPIISDSGEPFVRLPILPGGASPLILRVIGLTNSKSDTAPLAARIALTASAPSPEKIAEAKTLATFNHAERLRRSHTGADEALASYREAAAGAHAMHDPVLEQRALLSAGRMMMTGGKHYPEAVELERQATAIDNASLAPSVDAMAWKTLGGALLETGQYEESVSASRRALALYETTGEMFWQGIVLENLGSAALNLGEMEEALDIDERALAISRKLHDDFGVVEMLAGMGSIHESRGEYQQALDDFSDAVEVTLPSTYNPMQGEAWLAMGRLHQSLNEMDQAGDDFARSLTIAQHTSSGLDELDALGSIARLALANGKPEAAHASFTQALARARELKAVRPQSALLVGLAETTRAPGQAGAAEKLLREAVDLAASIHQGAVEAEAFGKLGELAEERRAWAEAAEDFKREATLYAAIPDKAGIVEAYRGSARVERAQGQLESALVHLTKAMDAIEGSRASLSQGGLRTRYFATQRATYSQAISVLMELDRVHAGAGYASQAWMVAERAQARSLLDEVTSSGVTYNKDEAGEALERRLAALDVQIRADQVSLAQTGTTPGDLEAANRIAGRLRQTLLASDELQSRLGRAEVEGRPGAVTGSALTPAEFARKSLTANDALVEYWIGEDRSYVWLIGGDGGCQAFGLPARAALEQKIHEYRNALLARDESPNGETATRQKVRLSATDGKTNELATVLGADLLPKTMLARLRDTRRLIVVPDGPLASLPFAGLRLQGPERTREQYLVERFDLVEEPSAAFLARAEEDSNPGGTPSRVAIFADPVYNLADTRLTSPVVAVRVASPLRRDAETTDLGHLSRLPGSRKEALAIQEIVGHDRASLFLGFDATPAAVHTLDWTKYGIAHFAAHAISQPGGRDLSGILLSMLDREGKRRNGILWLRDIYDPHVPRQLVVLSGCGTALGEAIPGEGMNSLTRAFLFSGTREVASTLWSADDVSSGLLMGGFYRALIDRRLPAPEALRQAQRQVMADPRYTAPYFWAGFIVEGRWKTR